MIEKIQYKKKLLAIIVRNKYRNNTNNSKGNEAPKGTERKDS